MSKLRMAVIGFEEIGGLYARAIHESEQAELVGVFDREEELSKPVAEEYKCRLYSSVEQLMEDKAVEAVCICMIDKYHKEFVELAAKAGKHILLDKPIAKTVEEAYEIKSLCETAKVKLMVAHLTAYTKQVIISREKCEMGELGELIQLSMRHHTPWDLAEMMQGSVDLMMFLGIHDVFTVQHILGKRIASVYAVSSQKKSRYSKDCIITALKFEDGAAGVIETGWQYPLSYPADIFSIVINGTEKTITSDGHISSFKLYGESFSNMDLIDCYEIGGKIKGAIADLLTDFAEGVRLNRAFTVRTEAAIDALLVVEAIMESLEIEAPVVINRQ